MDTLNILDRLEGAGVFIAVAGDRLRLTPGSCVPPEMLQVIRAQKRGVVRTLLVLREAEVVALQAEAQYREAQMRELRQLVATLESAA